MTFGFITILVTFFFSNCSSQFEVNSLQEEFASSLPSESNRESSSESTKDPHQLEKFKLAIEDGENIDVRQVLESYLSLLELPVSDLGTDLSSIVNEKIRRNALLPQENKSKVVNTVGLLSQSSLAGEVCRVYLNKKATTSILLLGLDLKKTPDKTPFTNWVNTFHLFADQVWGRNLTEKEVVFVKDFLSEFLNSVKTSPNLNKTISGFNVESMNLGIMICTAILSSPEATVL